MKDIECCSPALSITSDMTDEELDKYFASYEPLSNLPTPPPAKEAAMPDSAYASTSTASTRAPSPTRDLSSHPSELDVYATHLANLVPFNVSTRRPQHSLIRGFLERAYLPEEFVAMSACILDALSTRFATTWREALAPSDQVSFMHQDFRPSMQVAPDVIVLAALSLAHGFLADRLRSCRRWASKEGGNAFTLAQLEATKRAILQDMDYGLFRISEDRVQQRLRAMQLAVANSTAAAKMACTATTATEKPSRRRELSLSFSGAAMWSHGMSTPEPSP